MSRPSSSSAPFSEEAAKQQEIVISAKDSGGGFLIDEQGEDSDGQGEAKSDAKVQPSKSTSESTLHLPPCEECNERINKSFLLTNFSLPVCDRCRDNRGKHTLITRTDAKSEYLLKDCDLDLREPPLKFVLKKNPHEKARGDMRLYLKSQVHDRALLVWGSEDTLNEEKDKREERRRGLKAAKFQRNISELRRSLAPTTIKSKDVHVHDFDEEVCVDQEEDIYEKTCKTCHHKVRYEKM